MAYEENIHLLIKRHRALSEGPLRPASQKSLSRGPLRRSPWNGFSESLSEGPMTSHKLKCHMHAKLFAKNDDYALEIFFRDSNCAFQNYLNFKSWKQKIVRDVLELWPENRLA